MHYFKDTLPTVLLLLGSLALIVAAGLFITQYVLLQWGQHHTGIVAKITKTSSGVRRYQGAIDVRLTATETNVAPTMISVSGKSVDLYALNDAIEVVVPPKWLSALGLSAIVKRSEIDYVPIGVFLVLAVVLLLSSYAALHWAPKLLVINVARLLGVGALILSGYYQFFSFNKLNAADYRVTQATFDELFLSEYKQDRSKSDPRGSDYIVREYFMRVRYFDENKLEKRYILSAPSSVNPQELITICYNSRNDHVMIGGLEAIPVQNNTTTVVLFCTGLFALLLAWWMARASNT